VGEGAAVNWPVGAGGKGNEGVAAFVARLPNSIGYVEYSFVKQNKLTYALLKNRDGNFVAPDDDAFKAAAAGADWNKTFYQLITDQPGKNTWPISTATYILMYNKQDKPANATEALKFFNWAYANGGKAASDLDYVPMPPAVVAAVQKAWGTMTDNAGKAISYK
jgi:phosphate transport system substrate-binding protein